MTDRISHNFTTGLPSYKLPQPLFFEKLCHDKELQQLGPTKQARLFKNQKLREQIKNSLQ
jgi:hypothetical protein